MKINDKQISRREIRAALDDRFSELTDHLFEGMELSIRRVTEALKQYPVSQWSGNALDRPDVLEPFFDFIRYEKEANLRGANTDHLYNKLTRVCQPYLDSIKYWNTMIGAEAQLNKVA